MNWLSKVLNVRPKEWSRVLFLSTILIVSNVGTNWGSTVAYAAFLKQNSLKAGMETLIWVLLLSSILSIPALSIYTAFVDRIDNNRLFVYIIASGGVIILLGMFMWELNIARFAFPFIYVLSQAWLAIFNPHFFTYINDLFDIQSAKRVLPVILASGRIGAAIAGFSLRPLTNALGTEPVIWIWLLSDLIVIGVLLLMAFTMKTDRVVAEPVHFKPQDANPKPASSFMANMKEGWAFTTQSDFLRWMAIGTLLLAALICLLEYYANKIMVSSPLFSSSAQYAGFLGILDGISNLIALFILLFGINRMSKAWGIGNTSLAFPILSLFICGGVVGLPALLTASLAHLNRKGLRFSLQAPIEALLYNAIPIRIKGRARAFVGGLLSPLGAIVGVIFLLIELWYGAQFPWLIRGAIAFFAVAYLLSMFMIRYQYTQALVKMLEEEDYSFLLSEGASETVAADPATLQRLQQKLEATKTHEMRVFMTQLIAQVGGEESLVILAPVVKSAEEPRTRAAMLNVAAAAGMRGEKARELYVNFLNDADPQVRQAAASGLEQLLGAHDASMQRQWVAMLTDADPQVSMYALRSLAGTGQFYKISSAVEKLTEMLKSDSFETKKSAVDILGGVSHPQSVEQLLSFIDDAHDQIRLEAILSLEKISFPLGEQTLDERVLSKSAELLHDPVARVRQAALTMIGKFGGRRNYHLLIDALADRNPQVRTLAVDLLVRIGRDVVLAVQSELNSEDEQSRKMAAVVLSRINPRQFGHLIDQSVSDNLSNIYQNIQLEQALTPYETQRSVRVLLSVLRERNDEWIDEILYLLAAIHDAQTLRIVGESLHSDSSATRNLALEALESLTSPQTAALIASLFEPSLAPSQLLQLGQGSLHIENKDEIQALQKLLNNQQDRILFLLTLYAMGDMGAHLKSLGQSALGGESVVEQISKMLTPSLQESDALIRQIAELSLSKMDDLEGTAESSSSVSIIEKMIILKEVPFFRNVPASQLEMMAAVCMEKPYAKGEHIFKKGDLGGGLYIVVSGQIGIEQEKRGASSIIATLGKDSYFGEMSLFDNSPRSASAVVLENSVVLELNPAPVTTLTMQNPDLALELIYMLSQRIRETSNRLADTTRSRPRELHKLFDQFAQ